MKSMTGFGKATATIQDYEIDVEIKSINQRFLDIQLRSSVQAYGEWELAVRNVIKANLQRGRIECAYTIKRIDKKSAQIQLNWPMIDAFVEQMQNGFKERYGQELAPAALVNGLMQQPELFMTIEEEKIEIEIEDLIQVVESALSQLQASREREGAALKIVIEKQLQQLNIYIQAIEAMRQIFQAEHQKKLMEKLTELVGNHIEPDRVLTETAVIVDRSDVQEELDRLQIHIEHMEQLLQKTQPVGRELDFLIQEMNREINTIGSKSAVSEIRNHVVQLKTTLEKIREQVQNVE